MKSVFHWLLIHFRAAYKITPIPPQATIPYKISNSLGIFVYLLKKIRARNASIKVFISQ
jgi:hypothetical protein